MDAAAIKAYSSVIADAAEDSEPAQAVVYTKTMPDEPKTQAAPLDLDPMGSMIRNEISVIKDASVKAAKEKSDEWDLRVLDPIDAKIWFIDKVVLLLDIYYGSETLKWR